MRISARPIGLFAIYSGWFGCLVISYDAYPDPVWKYFVALAPINTGLVVAMMYFWSKLWPLVKDDDEARDQFLEALENAHIPTLRPQECERCAGFYHGLLGMATIFGGIILAPTTLSWIQPPWGLYLSMIGFVLFILGMVAHGLLNGLHRMDYLDNYGFLFTNRGKFVAGMIGGAGFALMGIGILSVTL